MKKVLVLNVLLCLLFTAGVYCETIKSYEFAGSWYPESPGVLRETLDKFFSKADVTVPQGDILGVISPHAGYIYPGPIAAYSYKALEGKDFDTVILMGPTHRYDFRGVSIYPEGSFETPLGNLEVDSEVGRQFKDLPFVRFDPAFFYAEHSLVVQLPFLVKVLGNVKIVPVIFGEVSYSEMQRLADKMVELSREKDFLVVVSTDLSHFHTYEKAKEIDTDTVDLIKRKEVESLWTTRWEGKGRACGIKPVVAFLSYVKARGGQIEILKYANSGDTAGDKRRVVGYLSALAYLDKNQKPIAEDKKKSNLKGVNMGEFTLTRQEKVVLLKIARSTLESYLKNSSRPKLSVDSETLKTKRGAFVTLNKRGDLRGCIGRIVGDTPLYETVAEYAIHAAVEDPRFPAVKYDELKDIEIEISVLTPFTEVKNLDEIEVGKHGLMIRRGFNSGLLLPQVPVEWGWDKKTFLEHTCRKAGLPVDAYKDRNATLYRFSAIVFNESEFEELE